MTGNDIDLVVGEQPIGVGNIHRQHLLEAAGQLAFKQVKATADIIQLTNQQLAGGWLSC